MLDTLIVGAGQAGLAAAYYLKQAKKDFLVIDAHARVGDSWRKRWEGLELFTPQRYNRLPGLTPPGGDRKLIDRLEAADYLEAYATHFSLPIQLHCTCVSAKKAAARGGYWRIETSTEVIEAKNLLLATGAYKDAYIPAQVSNTFPQYVKELHSSEVTSVEALINGPTSVLIVGAGASGQQLSRLCADAGAKVTLLGPKVSNLPRTLLGKDIYFWLYASGTMSLRTDQFPGKLLAPDGKGIVTVGEQPLPATIDRQPHHLQEYSDGRLRLRTADETYQELIPWPTPGHRGIVIWCTGYRNHYPFLPPELLDGAGDPAHRGGISTVDKSVAFLGLENLRRPSSSLLGGVGKDAGEVITALLG
ncbi:NAD(P)-binding domain-containing protein [Neolewinella antarctica]|uniref:Flavoprotein involved in K+ transport n=1 Tax=Neolewinella antarctica TaxID=442734 RepID=A0ABX0XBJ1_9BACT|nr:NAD(P)-binding domain-containing protein [Neolewinella antarctica]NJC26435.1 putative flavoprotein involved in K+ transport [Neolewinella antarctica]